MRAGTLPTPGWPSFMRLLFAHATSSGTLLAGRSLRPTSTPGVLLIMVIGVKSRSGSSAFFGLKPAFNANAMLCMINV